MKRPRQFRIEQALLDRFDRVNNAIAANGSEVVRKLIEKYVEEKEEELKMKVIETIEMKENFPVDGESYLVGKGENGKYFFAWGPEIPYEDEVPSYDIPEGESGIEWFATEKQALAAMNEAIEAIKSIQGDE